MNRLLSVSLCFLALLGCNETKNSGVSKNFTEEIIGEIEVPEIGGWEKRGIKMTNTNEIFLNKEVYNMEVIDHEESYTYLAINNIKIAYTGGRYRISIIIKQLKTTDNFGIRIQDVYPSRFDVVFDLKKETVRGTYQEGAFIKQQKTQIISLGEGWYKCTIDAFIYSSYFRLMFGPTNVPKGQTNAWESESLNNNNRSILVLTDSIKIEELDH